MNVILLIGSLKVGGAERQWVELANGLMAAGHRVQLMTLFARPGRPRIGGLDPGVVSETLVTGRTNRLLAPLTVFSLIRAIRGLAVEFRADIVYSALYLPNALHGLAVGRRRRWLAVWGIRTAMPPTGGARGVWVQGNRTLSSRCDLAIFNSESAVAGHAARGIRFRNIAVVRNEVDTVRFRPDAARRETARRALGCRAGDDLLGTVGRLEAGKGVDILLSAVATLAPAWPGLRLVIVGDGTARGELERQAERLRIQDRIIWTGFHAAVEEIYPALDWFVLPSLNESCPNALLEAMASGVPVVATRVGDVPLLVADRGTVVDPGSAAALARAIAWERNVVRDRAALAAGVASELGRGTMIRNTEAVLAAAMA